MVVKGVPAGSVAAEPPLGLDVHIPPPCASTSHLPVDPVCARAGDAHSANARTTPSPAAPRLRRVIVPSTNQCAEARRIGSTRRRFLDFRIPRQLQLGKPDLPALRVRPDAVVDAQ